ncbi:hypothetical protein KVH02_11680 [Streptomyces olivaceus]|uniref:Uncharacterized protein n=1 Tax=Streptomyces olivaceus TaxID=47716 RepID=A0ABS7W2G2_STROV|nr:hypothetical protein [Streptomyces olivaceus]MBZ6088981.1 hypothetical protein [Streptomyces olivaceus]MBZ6095645.1 hypothetical protein [Streptomyces olivaceus]MBZ6119914.1 hypothetical protein [Streptomyces olivaceus]MBZ6151465.1 hypothetical protein [Streptomyces olivaceus]MBZ6298413.1 hypothetical protein [Streptomyces olivaceus]
MTTPEAQPSSANAEAAKYRTKLREAEASLEAANARITAMQRREVAELAGKSLAVGADLFEIGGAELDSLLNDDGDVMPDAVQAAAEVLLAKRPGLANTHRPWGEVGGNAPGGASERKPTMADALRQR